MAKKLLIVESPAKIKTLRGFLDDEFVIAATLGHLRDLPERELGVDPADGFRQTYTLLPGKRDLVKRLRGLLKSADALYLATDPDREGEAIAWHLVELLKPRCPVYRVTFQSITAAVVKAAVDAPRRLDEALIAAQQARRVVDRLVGYALSPLLWTHFDEGGLSAGRVQTVGLRLVVERERAIAAFQPQTCWSLAATFEGRDGEFTATLNKWKDAEPDLPDEAAVRDLMRPLADRRYRVTALATRETARRPSPPFTTSTLQQAASVHLGWSPETTMIHAQALYEGVEMLGKHTGLITYMRTDSVQVAPEAAEGARAVIRQAYGRDYLPGKPPNYTGRNQTAQEAHEAIRPTDPARTPEQIAPFIDADWLHLYTLIWSRFIASQMCPAQFQETQVTVRDVETGEAVFTPKGRHMVFDGWRRVYDVEAEESEADEADPHLPPLREGEGLRLTAWEPVAHVTRPPKRYTEASLVAALERAGVGRPSTYASTLATLRERGYIQTRRDRKLEPTERGRLICDYLLTGFPDLFAPDFTARLEADLDAIAAGNLSSDVVLSRFWEQVAPAPHVAEAAARQQRLQRARIGEDCPDCGQPLVKRKGKKGHFVGCSAYPDCTYTRDLPARKSRRKTS